MEQLTKEAVEQKRRSKAPWIALGVLLALLAAYGGLCAYARSLDTFYPNTSLNGVEVGGLTAAQAAERMGREIPEKTLSFYLPLADEVGDGETAPEGETLYEASPAAVVSYGELGLTGERDYQVAADFAFRRSQRERSPFLAGWDYLGRLLGRPWPLAAPLEPEEAQFQKRTASLAETFSRPPQDAAYTVEEGALLVTREQNGLQVAEETLAEAVRQLLSQGTGDSLQVEAAILPAKALTAQEIYDEVSGEVKSAGYDAATGTITPERVGADFDAAAAQALLDAAAPGETVTVPAQVEFPKVTAQELEKVLFRDVLGQCRTHVGGTAARISNVKLASAAFDGTVLNSGDVFSYNETVGQRTTAKGYQAAPAYVKGETVDEIGGGVCQPSSTLYYACLRGNLEITERYAHRYVPAYIDWGMDATVSWGGPDYKFTNNTDYPIKIVATYDKGYLTVQLLGTNVDGTSVRMTNEVLSTTPWETVYEDDPTLPAGTEQVKVTPYTGYQVKSYRNLYGPDGKLISSAYEATSSYKVRNKVILRGPAVVTEPEAPVMGPADLPSDLPADLLVDLPVELPADTPALPEDPAEPAISQTELPVEVPEEPDLPLE